MAKLAQSFAKYLIHARIEATGIVEKPDIIGAIFGQTEGLLGTDLDLRELQRTGRIGRIEVMIRTSRGRSFADILIPSSLDSSETALIAASLETIDKIGPCDAKIEIIKVEDVRSQKRRYVIERAKDILKAVIEEGVPDSQKIAEMVRQAVRSAEISSYHGLSCGPDLMNSDEIIIVEGRADVINLLKNGIRNCIAIEGSKIPDTIINLTREKITTALLDGDRGGELVLKKLLAVAELDFVARAPEGKEVEELTKKQIFKALRERVPIDQITEKPVVVEEIEKEEIEEEKKEFLANLLDDLTGSKAAYLLDKNLDVIGKIPLSEMSVMASESKDFFKNIYGIVIDGKINQLIVDLALQNKIHLLVGTGYKEDVKSSQALKILVADDLRTNKNE